MSDQSRPQRPSRELANSESTPKRSIAMRRIVLIVLCAVAALAAATAARADGPQIVQDTVVVSRLSYFTPVNNAPLCAGGFKVLFSAVIDRTTLNFFDDTGKLVIRRRHNQFAGTLINSATGYALPYEGEVNFVFDFQTGTTTITGGTKRIIVPQQGMLAIEAGRRVLSMSSGAILEDDGQHDFDSQLCALLDH